MNILEGKDNPVSVSNRQDQESLVLRICGRRIRATWICAVALFHRNGYPLIALVRRDLQMRYATTALGLGWTALQPLALLVLYVLVFGFILRIRVHPGDGSGDFALYLMSGMLPYMALAEGIQRASTSLRENRGLLAKVIFPAEVLPAVSVVSATLTEGVGLILVIGLAVLFHRQMSVWLLLLPLLVLLRIMLTMGFAWLVSVLTVFIGDFSQFLGLMLTAWLFLTPIFYSADAVPGGLRWLLVCNPLHDMVVAYRAVLLQSANPLPAVARTLGWAVGFAAVGLWFFRKTLDRAKGFL